MRTFSYDIYQRQSSEHRAGSLGLMIEGVETEVTTDPMQFMPKALVEAAGDPVKAQEICESYARQSLQRRINRLKRGMMPGKPGLAAAGTAADLASDLQLKSEPEAVDAFLNRGTLQGLDKDQRKQRKAKRDEKRDHEGEWQKRRLALIAKRQAELKEWEDKLNKVDPQDRTPKALHIRAKAERAIRALKTELNALQPGIMCASHGYQYGYGQYITKQVDLVNDDIRIAKLSSNTTADTERDAVDHGNDITTPDEFDGSGYTSGGQALDSQAVNIDDANDRAEFDAADEAAALGAGTRAIQGNLLISFITNFSGSLVLHWIEYASNKTPDGSTFTDVFNAEGILQMADG